MWCRVLVALLVWLLLDSRLLALDAAGTIKSVDAKNGTVVVFVRGQDRTMKADASLKVLDKQGMELAGGLASPELQPGTQVTVTVQRDPGGIVLFAMQLGAANVRPAGPPAAGNFPERTSVGLKPLSEMTAEDRYQGEDGGLYGEGRNEPPPQHLAAAQRVTANIVPLDREGRPSATGTIVMVSISMSNATQEFSTFKRIADQDPDKSSRLTIVDCAQGGQAMAQWARPDARPWAEAERRLAAANVSPSQVQIAWIKLANVSPSGDLSQHGKKLYDDTLAVLQIAREKFPNLRIAYLGSRIYAGYARGRLNPEPYAYESALVVRWLLRDQMQGESALNFDPDAGPVKTPLLLWGPYFWADGTTGRAGDGLVWQREDLGPDGTHPSDLGRQKVAQMLLTFFKTDACAKTWFTRN